MADAGRKDLSTKMGEKITPDSTKSTGTIVKEDLTGGTDKIARSVQPDHDKSTTQEASDKLGRSKDTHAHGGTGPSILDKAKDALHMNKKA